MRILHLFVLFLLTIVQTGCVSDPVKFTNSSTANLDLTHGKKVVGKAGGMHLFYLIPIGINSRQQSAYDDMMMKVGSGYYIADINVLDQWKWVFIGTKCNTYMTGIAYPIKENKPVAPMTPPVQPIDPTAQKLEELKRLYKAGHLSDTEYEAARRKALGL